MDGKLPGDGAIGPAIITMDGPNDWLAAAAARAPGYPATRWGRHKAVQAGRCRAYLAERAGGGSAGTETVIRRAAVILAAAPAAPELERMLGIRIAAHLEGQDVKCRACRRTWPCLPEDPCYEAAGPRDGLCAACMLAETRRDVAVPAIEPAAVTAPARPRARTARPRARAAADSRAPGPEDAGPDAGTDEEEPGVQR